MRKCIFIRLFACLLILCLLTGCGGEAVPTENTEPSETGSAPVNPTGSESTSPESTDTEPGETEPTEPSDPTQSMPEEELNLALLQLEYAILPFQAAMGDVNQDGIPELYCGNIGLSFDIMNNRRATFYYSQNGICFYADNDGTIYMCDSFGGGHFDEEAGIFSEGYDQWFSTFNGSEWEPVLSTGYSLTMTYTWDEQTQEWVDEQTEEINSYTIGDQEVTESVYSTHLKHIGLTNKFIAINLLYDADYAEALWAALESRLEEAYSLTTLRKDIDGDGEDEMIFAAADMWAPWRNNIHRNIEDEWSDTAEEVMGYGVPLDQIHTGILIGDIYNGNLVFKAYNVQTEVRLTEDTDVQHGLGQIWIDGFLLKNYKYAPN